MTEASVGESIQKMLHLHEAVFCLFPFFPLNSRIYFACVRFSTPCLFFLMSSIAFGGVQPLFTRAKATKKGARPRPATQCTPILLSAEDESGLILARGFYDFDSSPSIMAVELCRSLPPFPVAKKLSTVSSHFLINSFEGSCPSGNCIS